MIREQGVTFAVVIVKQHVVSNNFEADCAIQAFRPAFPGLPIVLMAQDSGESRPTTVVVTCRSSWRTSQWNACRGLSSPSIEEGHDGTEYPRA